MIEDTGFGEGALFDPDGAEGTEGSCTCVADGCGCIGCNTHNMAHRSFSNGRLPPEGKQALE